MNDKQPKSARNCPGLDKTITPKECGADRISKVPCPTDCHYHPFIKENAEGLTALEERLLKKMQKRAMEELGGDQARELARTLRECEDEVEHFLLIMQAVHAPSKVEGPDFVERWEKDRFEGLNNDERTLMKAQQSQRPALLRIERVADAQSMEVVDLLEPEAKTLTVVVDVELDPAMEGDVLLGWIYEAPQFTRLSGPAFELPEHDSGGPLEALREIAASLEGPSQTERLRLWLRTRMVDVYRALVEAEAGEEEEGDEDDEPLGIGDVLDSFDWSELPDYSKETLPRQRQVSETEIDDRLAPFLHRFNDAEQAVQWFEESWQDIASGIDQLTEGVLSDEGFGVVLILLAKAAAVLHPRPPHREGADPLRFIWQLGNELRASSRIMVEELGEEAFESYVRDSPQPTVSLWLCEEAAAFADGEEAVFDDETIAVAIPVVKAAIWEMCHWVPA